MKNRALALGLALLAAAHSAISATSEHPAAAASPRIWMIQNQPLSTIAADGQARAALATRNVYDLASTGRVQTLVAAHATAGFTDVNTLSDSLRTNKLGSTGTVLLDLEHWSFTPATQQRSIDTTQRRAAVLAHADRRRLIVSPALDLMAVLAPSQGPYWQSYLRLNIAGRAAASGADMVEIQAQSLEGNPLMYANFVRQAAAQARKANSHVIVLAGLSTGPTGVRVTTATIPNAARAAASDVQGFWLNVPAPSPKCPDCVKAASALAISAIQTTT